MNYTVCPTCGYKLVKAGEGSIDFFCPKCGQKLMIEIKDGKMIVEKTLSSKAE